MSDLGSKNRLFVLYITHSAVIAAVYVVLNVVFAPISFGAMQVRVSEMLTIMPMFTASAVPGLFIGCLIGNILGGAVIWDVIFGSIATLIGALGGYLLRFNRWLVPIPTIISNMLIVPIVLVYGYGINIPYTTLVLYIAAGEFISCYILGEILASAINRYADVLKIKK